MKKRFQTFLKLFPQSRILAERMDIDKIWQKNRTKEILVISG